MKRHVISTTSDTTGAATVYTDDTVNGRIYNFMLEFTSATTTADVTVTTRDTSQTILAVSNVTSPKTYAPRQPIHKAADGTQIVFSSTTGGSAGYDYMYACNEQLKIVVAEVGDSKALRFCIITDG